MIPIWQMNESLITQPEDILKGNPYRDWKRQRELAQTAADAGLMATFLRADFSAGVLGTGYVEKKEDMCLDNIELIRRVREKIDRYTEKNAASVRQKLDAVRTYADAVERAQLERTLEARELDAKEKDDYGRPLACLERSMLQLYLDLRRFKSSKKNQGEVQDAYREDPTKTSDEARLSMLEARYQIPVQEGYGVPIMRTFTRSVHSFGFASPGDVIRVSEKDVQGKRESLAVKKRFSAIYYKLAERLTNKYQGENASEFLNLWLLIYRYVNEKYDANLSGRAAEEQEKGNFEELVYALVNLRRHGESKCSKYAAILLGLLVVESSGYLEVPPNEICVIEDSRISMRNETFFRESVKRGYRECRNMPLFLHRPNITDIVQGNLSDCYLLAGLISVVYQNPEEIMNIMRDNGDGTVTVCFRPGEIQADGRRAYRPYYVTVRKTIPVNVDGTDAFSNGAFWVKMMEKAYVASGLHLGRGREMNRQDYQALREYILFSEPGVNYDDISGGSLDFFLCLLLGKDCEAHSWYEYRTGRAGGRVNRLLQTVNGTGQKSRSAAGKKAASHNNRNLQRRIAKKEDRKAAMSYFDIVKTVLAAEGNCILRLNTIEEIEEWYEKKKRIFAYFKRKYKRKNVPRDIYMQKTNYVGENDSTFRSLEPLLFFTTEQFSIAMNILKQQHLARFSDNIQRGQGAGNGNALQIPYWVYTEGELKLYAQINNALQNNRNVVFGTKDFGGAGTGKNGETESGGLVGRHAYSVIGTHTEMYQGKAHLFLVVANPWACQGVVYGVGEKSIWKSPALLKHERGVFFLDLQTFAKVIDQWAAVPPSKSLTRL